MGTSMNGLGWSDTGKKLSSRNQKVVLAKSAGGFYVVLPEWNASGMGPNYGDGSTTNRLKIFDVNDDFTTSNLVFNSNVAPWNTPGDVLSADVFSNNDIGVIYEREDTKAICYRKITAVGWTAGNQEIIYTPSGGSSVRVADIALTDGNVPVVAFLEQNTSSPKLVLKVYTRNTANNWILSRSENLMSGANPNSPYLSVSIASPSGGSATARPVMVATDSASTNEDQGSEVFSAVVNESTGTMVNFTKRQQLLKGNMGVKSAFYPRRSYLFTSGTSEITYVHMEAADKKNVLVYRFTFDGNSYVETIVPQTFDITINPNATEKFAASYANDVVNLYYVSATGGKLVSMNYLVKIDRTTAAATLSGPYRWDNSEADVERVSPMAGTGRYARTATRHGMINLNRSGNGKYDLIGWSNQLPPAPTEVAPNGTLVTGTPQVSLKARLGKNFPQSKHKAVWQFALDANFTQSVKTYTQPDDKFTLITNTAPAASYHYISDTLPDSLALTSGTWFVRAALVDEFGRQGAWGGSGSVSLSHPPAASDLLPNAGMTVSDIAVQFLWKFTDAKVGDTQTAFQIIVERSDTGATVLDTGKVSSTNSTTFQNLPTGLEGIMLRWQVRLWDADNVAGVYSEFATFQIAAPSTVTIDAPGAGSTNVSGSPMILFTPTMPVGRRAKAFTITLSVGSTVMRSSGTVPIDVATGTQVGWRVPEPMLQNGVTYTINLTILDDANLTATAPAKSFITNWTAPAAASGVTLDTSKYNVDDMGYVLLTWSNANQDPDFEAWVIERKQDAINQTFDVVEEGTWQEVGRVTDTSGTPSFRDFYAPSSYKVSYIVRQLVNRAGERAISTNEPANFAFLQSEGYWLIEPFSDNGQPSSFRLFSVTDESYSPEWEEAEYVVAGRGRHIDRGDYLGVKGSLTAKLRDDTGSSARMKKLRLEAARNSESAIYLRNPFGDVYYVSIGNLSISRIAGVGKSEFVDVTVPYSEVFK